MSALFSSVDFFNNFSVFKEASSFKEKEAFNKIRELGFLSYYKDFKLVLCSKCFLGLNSTAFKSHIIKHLLLLLKKEKDSLIAQALLVYKDLEVFSLKESLRLINLFTKSFELQVFKELKVLDLFLCNFNNNCFVILSNKYSIKRHLRENHSSSSFNTNSSTSSYKVIKRQALEINKFFFEIKSNNSFISNLSISDRLRSSSPRIDSIERAKESFIANYFKKEEIYLEKLSSFKLDPKEKLSPFQIKTRYIEYINKYNIKDLVDLVAPLSKEEKVLEILIINLKEILYLSLEKSIFLNKIHLNILNSFKDNKIRNKPFQPIITSNSQVKYFNFFSLFLIFFFRALSKDLEENISYFKVDNSIVTIYNLLKNNIELSLKKGREEDYLKLSNKSLKRSKKTLNKKLERFRLNNLTNNQEDLEEEVETSSSSSLDSSLNSNSSSTSNNSSSSKSLSNSSNSNNSNNSNSFNKSLRLDSSNIEILKRIKEINKSKDSLSLKIKELLIELLIKLLKQTTDLYIFDSSINSFFASISIRAKDYSFKDSLDLSQDYSKFIYSF